LQDGDTPRLDLTRDSLNALATRLSANLDHLPLLLCRICRFQQGIGSFEVDEYPDTLGYGFVYEEPTGKRMQAAIRTMKTFASPVGAADVPANEERVRAILLWFATLGIPSAIGMFSDEENAALARENPAGTGRQWKALYFLTPCPILADMTLIVLASALLPQEPFEPEAIISFWQRLAANRGQQMRNEDAGER
jgi:hypothetical protein